MLMGLFSTIFGTQEERNLRTCLRIYSKAKKARPGKAERDYLKLVLISAHASGDLCRTGPLS
jgi:hypothetical protein